MYKDNLSDDMYVFYPKIMDSKCWWIVEMIIGLLGVIGLLLMLHC